jgi:dTMP kinase
LLIAVTGIDGAEPTNAPWGRIIKGSATTGRLSPRAIDAFLNDSTEHVDTLIAPALEQGRIVILDRYFGQPCQSSGNLPSSYKTA